MRNTMIGPMPTIATMIAIKPQRAAFAMPRDSVRLCSVCARSVPGKPRSPPDCGNIGKKPQGRLPGAPANSHSTVSVTAVEELDGALVLLRLFPRGERAKVAAFAGPWVGLSRIEPVLSGL